MVKSNLSSFSIMTWLRSCFSLGNGKVAFALDGVELDEQYIDHEDFVIGRGNLTLHLGKSLIGSITHVNMFSPALKMENMLNLTSGNAGKDYCGKEGNLFNWKDFTFKTGDKETEPKNKSWILHGKANSKAIIQSNGPCAKQSSVNVNFLARPSSASYFSRSFL